MKGKKFIFSFNVFILIMSCFVFAESYDEKIAYVQDLSSNCTLEYIDNLETELTSVLSKNDPRFALLNYRRGIIYTANAQYSDAVEVLLKAVRIYKRAGKDYKASLVASEFGLANAYYYLAQYDDSISHYKTILDLVSDTAGKHNYDYAITSLSIGNCYYGKGDYDNAILFCSDASDIFLDLYGSESTVYAFSQNTLGLFYDGKGEFEIAKKLINESILIYDKNLSQATASSCIVAYNNLALVYQHTGEYVSSLKTYEHAAKIAEEYKSDLNINLTLAIIYSNISTICDLLGYYEDAYDYIMKSIQIREAVLGENDYNTAVSYSNLAGWFYKQGDYANATLYGEKALSAIIVSLGKENPNTLSVMDNVAVFYREKGEFETALSMHTEVLEIRKKLLGETHYETAKSYNYLGMLYDTLGDFKNSLIYFAKAVDIYETLFGSMHEQTLLLYNNIGNVYYRTGDFSDAILWQLKALSSAEHVFGKNHVTVSTICSNLSLSYRAYGDYDSAQSYAEHALSIQLDLFGENHPDSAIRYNNLALVYRDKNDLDRALECFNKSVEIYNNLYVDGLCPELETIYSNLSAIYSDKAQFDEAIKYGKLAVDLAEEYYGESNPKTLGTYINLASAYWYNGDLNKALRYNRKAVSSAESCYGINSKNPNLAMAYYNLAFSYQEKENVSEAAAYFKKAYAVWRESANFSEILECLNRILTYDVYDDSFIQETLELAFSVLERSRVAVSSLKSKYMQQAKPIYYFGLEFAKKNNDAELAFWCSESIRNRSFLDQVGVDAALNLDGVTDFEKEQIRSLMTQIEDNRKIVERQYIVSEEEQNMDDAVIAAQRLSEAEYALSKIDNDIGMRVPKYAQLRNPSPISLSVAQEFCGKNRCVLEYVIASSKSYCIVITDKKSYIVELDDTYDYSSSVTKLHDAVAAMKPERNFERVRNELYEKLVAPLSSYIKGKKSVLIVPDANLALLPFEILRSDSDSKMLGEQFSVALSPSVSVSYISKQINVTGSSVFALGGAWYDSSLTEDEHNYVLSNGVLVTGEAYPNMRTRSENKTGWNDLPGTMTELSLLKNSVFVRQEFFSLTQKDATEYNIKKLSEQGQLAKFSIVHFACHGYFNRPNNNQPTAILLSEVSTSITDSDEDGYLTIPEATLLNLNADLVCLSACETGIVESDESDDMSGLSRAFMVAGAKHVAVSLWEASDVAAAEFMTRMYKNVLKGMDYSTAYKTVKAEFRRNDDWSHPFYWALYTIYE